MGTRIGLMRTGDLESQWSSVLLRHPKLDELCEYFLSADGTRLLEAQQTDGTRSSWFVGDAVQRDGSLLLLTPVHAIFMVLPLLYPASEASKSRPMRYTTIEQLLEEKGATELARLAGLRQLDRVCDTQEIDEIGQLYRINTEKMMSWLTSRVNTLAAAVPDLSSPTPAHKAEPLRFALEVVAEHLPEHIETMLRDALAEELAKSAPAPAPVIDMEKAKAARPLEDYGSDGPSGPVAKKAKLTASQRALAEQAKGMRSMASFFGKKA